MIHRESALQQQCMKYFRLQYPKLGPLYFSVPNGAHVTESQASLLFAEGLTAGVADTLLLYPTAQHHGLCVEFKTESVTYRSGKRGVQRTYQNPAQKQWQEAVEAQGYRYEVVRSLDQFITTMRDYFDEH